MLATPPLSEAEEEEGEEAVLTRQEIHAELSRAKQNMAVLEEEYRAAKLAWRHHTWRTNGQLITTVLPTLVHSYAQIRAIKKSGKDLWQQLVRLDYGNGGGEEESDPLAIGRIASQWYAQERLYKKYATIINRDLRARGETFRYTFEQTLPSVDLTVLTSTAYKKRVMSDYSFFQDYREESVQRLIDIEVEWHFNKDYRYELEQDWYTVLSNVKVADQELTALVEEMSELGYQNVAAHVPYGMAKFENVPPWLDMKLKREVEQLERQVQEATLELEHVKEMIKLPRSLDTLRKLYTTLGQGKLRVNASKKMLEEEDAAVQGARLQKAESTLRHYQMRLDEAQKALQEYQARGGGGDTTTDEGEEKRRRLESVLLYLGKRITPEKAREILHHGSVHGHPLTEKQRRYFGWQSSKRSKE
jgi:hypothetical protein